MLAVGTQVKALPAFASEHQPTAQIAAPAAGRGRIGNGLCVGADCAVV